MGGLEEAVAFVEQKNPPLQKHIPGHVEMHTPIEVHQRRKSFDEGGLPQIQTSGPDSRRRTAKNTRAQYSGGLPGGTGHSGGSAAQRARESHHPKRRAAQVGASRPTRGARPRYKPPGPTPAGVRLRTRGRTAPADCRAVPATAAAPPRSVRANRTT